MGDGTIYFLLLFIRSSGFHGQRRSCVWCVVGGARGRRERERYGGKQQLSLSEDTGYALLTRLMVLTRGVDFWRERIGLAGDRGFGGKTKSTTATTTTTTTTNNNKQQNTKQTHLYLFFLWYDIVSSFFSYARPPMIMIDNRSCRIFL